MGLIAKILDSFIGNSGELAAKVEMYKNDNVNARIYNPSGIDSRPLDNDICFSEISEDTEGGRDVLGFLDLNNAPVSAKGEFRAYSRNDSGETQAELYMKKTGLTDLKNQIQTLSLLISELFSELRSMTTAGGPTAQAIDAATQARLTTLENKYKQLIG
jgi:hypothetical protein